MRNFYKYLSLTLITIILTFGIVKAAQTNFLGVVFLADPTTPSQQAAISAAGALSVSVSGGGTPSTTSAFTDVAITITTSGNTPVVGAVSAKTTKMYRLTLSCQNTTTINIQDGSTVKMGPYYLLAGGSITLDTDVTESPWIVGSTNTALNINSSTVVNCGGSIGYINS